WPVNTDAGWQRGSTLRVLTTRQLREDLTRTWYLPLVEPPHLECGEARELDPYLVGLQLGDGCMDHGKVARETFIPAAYLNAPAKERHALLQGLMDTNGTLGAEGRDVSAVCASRRLAEDVAWLTRSLGGYARSRPVTKAGAQYWMTSVALPDHFPPFRLERKHERWRPGTARPR